MSKEFLPKYDLTGKQFGRLFVDRLDKERSSQQKNAFWLCVCACDGKEKSVSANSLLKDKSPTRSCGCIRQEKSTIHGQNGKNLDKVYNGMVARCYNETHKSYKSYGALGIHVCDEWMEKTVGRHRFFKWSISNGYKNGLTLDRKDGLKGYSPDNCRWADKFDQARNKSNNRIISAFGEDLCIADAVEKFSPFDYGLVLERINAGWTPEDALTRTPNSTSKYRYFVVTGGLGFLGSCLVDYLVSKFSSTHKVVIIDKDTYAADERKIRSERSKYHLYREDIVNNSKLEDIIKPYSKKIDCIFHLAAESMVDRSINGPREFIRSNIVGTFNILEIVRKYKISMIYQSTDEIFGSLSDNDLPWTELSPVKPNNPYAASKACAELLVNSYISTYQLPIKVFRSCNVFGESQHEEKMIVKSIKAALSGNPIQLYPDGEQKREWIYQSDYVSAVMKVFEAKQGSHFNVFSDTELSNKDLCCTVLNKVHGTNRSFDYWFNKGFIKFVDGRKSHDYRYSMSGNSLKELGWKPKVSFEEGLKRIIDDHQERREDEEARK